MSPREIVIKIQNETEREGAYANAALNKYLNREDLKAPDRAFITALTYGIIKNRTKLDFIISKFSSIKLKKLSLWTLYILRAGIFQMHFMDKIPHSAAVNESVKLAKKYCNPGAVKFINAILRSVSTNIEKISFPQKVDGLVKYLEIEYSHPLWIIELLISQYGTKVAEKIVDSNNQSYSPAIRINTLKTNIEKLAPILESEGIQWEADTEIDSIFYVKNALNIEKLSAYKNGLFTLQNKSSCLAGLTVSPKENEFIIDMCAAPGGKTTHMAEIMKNKGKIIAFDIYEHKTKLIEKAENRLGITIIETKTCDSTIFCEEYAEKADAVLLDAPCSGLGVISRKPDIRWKRKPEDLEELKLIQEKLLRTAAKYVKTTGRLIYSTCTINKEENENQIASFLEKNKDFQKISEQTIFTHETGGSGFYICKMERKQSGYTIKT